MSRSKPAAKSAPKSSRKSAAQPTPKAARSKQPPSATKSGALAAPKSGAKPVAARPKKLSALSAAADLLARTGESLSCRELIERLAAEKLWTSPAGKTPQATLYAAISREIAAKGSASRFCQTERGRFAARG